MQNFREKYAYRMSLYLMFFLSLFLGLWVPVVYFSIFLSTGFTPDLYFVFDFLHTISFLFFFLSFIIFSLVFFLRYYSLELIKKWKDLFLFIPLIFIFFVNIFLKEYPFCFKELFSVGIGVVPYLNFYDTCASLKKYLILSDTFMISISLFFIINIFLSIKYLIDLKRKNTNEIIL